MIYAMFDEQATECSGIERTYSQVHVYVVKLDRQFSKVELVDY